MDGFSLLPKDKKTFKIILSYVHDINEKRSLLKEDCAIQKFKIMEHNFRCGFDDSTEWIEKNAKKERQYLNACKVILYEMLKDKCIFNWENTCYFIDNYNTNIYPILKEHGDLFGYFI